MASECIGGKLKASAFGPNDKKVGKLAFERCVLILEVESEAIQSQRIKMILPENAVKRRFKIRGSCILPRTQHNEENLEFS